METKIPQPGSYVAIEMMRHGVPYEDVDRLRKTAMILCDLSGCHDQAFIDGAMINAPQSGDRFLDIRVLELLLGGQPPDPGAVTLTGYFMPETDRMLSTTNEETGINAYMGKAVKERVLSFFVRQASWLAGDPGDVFARSMARKHAAKFVLANLVRRAGEFRERHLSTETRQRALLRRLGKEAPEFPVILRNDLVKAKEAIEACEKELFREFDRARIFFCKAQSSENVAAGVKRLLSLDATAGYTAKGVRRWGMETFLERARDMDAHLRELELPGNKRLSLLARIASGRGADPDPGWLVHLDKGNIFSYRVPAKLQKRIKAGNLAIKCVMSGVDAHELGSRVTDLVRGHPLLECLGMGHPDLMFSAWCAVGRGVIAGKTFGEEDEGWEALEKLREIVPEGIVRSGAPRP